MIKHIQIVQCAIWHKKTKSTRVYIEILIIPFLCLFIQGQSMGNLDMSKYNCLKNLDFTG